MEKSLKRCLDFRLVYDCLADPCGLIRLELLLSHWPTYANIPRACETFWRQKSTADGFLEWRAFAGGLQTALQAHDGFKKSGQPKVATDRRPVAQVTSGEIERFLSSCRSGELVKALAKAGRDMHRWQVSIHNQDSHKGVATKEKTKETAGASEHHMMNCTSLSAAREKEELLRGAEVLQNTQRWFQSRLAVLSAELKQKKVEQLGPEEVLAEMDAGEEDSFVLEHLKQINSHLSSLALTANPLPPPMPLQTPRPHPARPTAVVEYPSLPKTRASGRWREPQLHHSISLPARAAHPAHRHPPPPSRPLHRSSSFSDKSNAGLRSQPVRQASSMTTLSQQVTDYPGHRAFSLQRPIRHSSSVQSLSGKPQSLPRPPPRAHSTRSLTQDHQLVSEVL